MASVSMDAVGRILEPLRHTDDEDWRLLVTLASRAGERAASWQPREDRYKAGREADRDFVKAGLPGMLAATSKLERLAGEHARGFDAVVWRAVKKAGLSPDALRAAGYEAGSGGQGGAFVRALLAAMRAEFEAEAEPKTRRAVKAQGVGGAHRRVHGALKYPNTIDDRTQLPDARVLGLKFELYFLVRRYSAGRKTREIQFDDGQPTIGEPHHRLVADIVRSALGLRHDDDAGAAFTKATRGLDLRWWGWGGPETGHGDEVIAYWPTDPND